MGFAAVEELISQYEIDKNPDLKEACFLYPEAIANLQGYVRTDLTNFIYPKHLIDFLSSWYYNLAKVILKRGAKMPRITSKGQITIPQDIRDKFGFLPGMEVDVIAEGNKALIVKSRRENKFIKWLGRGKRRPKIETDQMVDEIRGRSDE
jgi:AbrB family looped-hinge helix DNA binding protein